MGELSDAQVLLNDQRPTPPADRRVIDARVSPFVASKYAAALGKPHPVGRDPPFRLAVSTKGYWL